MRTLTIVIVVAAGAVGAMTVYATLGMRHSASEIESVEAIHPATLAPYTVTLQERVTRADGTIVPATQQTHALRSDGSMVFVANTFNAPDGRRRRANREISFAHGVIIQTDDIRELKSTKRSDPTRISMALRSPRSRCTRTLTGAPFPNGEMAGQIEKAHEMRVVPITNKDGLKMWFAVDLSCAPMGHVWTFSQNTQSRLEPTDIRPGEPDAALFSVPSHYQEVPPSTIEGLDPESEIGRRRDAVYRARQ